MSIPKRPKIICLGVKAGYFDSSEFEYRNLILEYKDKIETNDLIVSRGIILYFNKDKQSIFKKHINELGHSAENHGVILQAYCVSESDYLAMKAIVDDSDCNIDLGKISMPVHALAEKFRRKVPAPAPNNALVIDCIDVELNETQKLLLKIAFHDCVKIFVRQLSGGLSGEVSLSVHAVFSDSRAGLRPLPFFAKIDERDKIQHEINNYQIYVHHFIPFNLRPNLSEDRCFIGACVGVIVGNLAEYTESLFYTARRGVARQAINSLFDDSLRGWRIQADKVKKNPAIELNQGDKLVFDPVKCKAEISGMAFEIGAKKSPDKLLEDIYQLPVMDFYETPIHGDLHSKNVLVRNTEAILIDFERTRRGPLLSDIASLEVSLVFDTAEGDTKEGWRKLIDSLYSEEFLFRVPGPAKEPRKREWMWECVRILRQRAFSEQFTLREYPLMLAMYLLRRSHWTGDKNLKDVDTFRRAYAYVIAEKLVDMVNRL